MTPLQKFTSQRAEIVAALRAAGLDVLLNKDDVPRDLPVAIVILNSETGKHSTSRRFADTDLSFTVYLVINALNNPDPDLDLYTYKEAFRSAYLAAANRDFPQVEYYTSRGDGGRQVRIAKIDLLKPYTGAAS